jgi:hypothetical protein
VAKRPSLNVTRLALLLSPNSTATMTVRTGLEPRLRVAVHSPSGSGPVGLRGPPPTVIDGDDHFPLAEDRAAAEAVPKTILSSAPRARASQSGSGRAQWRGHARVVPRLAKVRALRRAHSDVHTCVRLHCTMGPGPSPSLDRSVTS